VREFCELAFSHAGIPVTWSGGGASEKGISSDGRILVEIDPYYYRPTEVDSLLGDARRAREKLGWEPKVGFRQLVRMMVDSDLALAAGERRAAGKD
jgi:GDPmannose 4,6-dehydratase